ncbi:hypothetical protein [Microvirga zambiensis]|uniref:hypothetical protein n=1 Tax=Microvirga zambiensis TaxID=1402137 RepID=UPI00191E6E2F|nr:hypothetical protein [Microvirga zambiensis]
MSMAVNEAVHIIGADADTLNESDALIGLDDNCLLNGRVGLNALTGGLGSNVGMGFRRARSNLSLFLRC